MKNNEFGYNPYEAPTESSEKPDKKDAKSTKNKLEAKSPQSDKQQQAERRIAKSIDTLSLLERKDSAGAPSAEAPQDDDQQSPEEISTSEASHIERDIAREHLAAIAETDEATAAALATATEFLQRVSDGVDVETAFTQVAAENGLSEAEIAVVLHEDSEVTDEAQAEPAEYLEDEADPDVLSEEPVSWRPQPTPKALQSAAGGGSGSGYSQPPSVPGYSSAAPAEVSAASTVPEVAQQYYEQRTNGSDLLLGGALGYLMCRRRGRIKTEKRLLPVQQKLEAQVTNLEKSITQKERQLVALTAARASNQSLQERIITKTRRPEAPAQAIERAQPGRHNTRLGLEKPGRAEQLGHMVVLAEAPAKIVERLKQPGNIREAFRAESVKDMDRHQLLELSEKITVEGASLRRIYESSLIGERQLRHLVAEYLDGKDIRKDLRREMVEREIDFERDPILRDRVRSKLAGSNEGGGLGDLLAKAGITNDQPDEAMQHRILTDQKRQQVQQQKSQRQRTLADTAMATAIVVLAVAVIILVTRG